MSLLVKTGTFHLDSTLTAGNTIVISGVGFQPKVVFFFSAGRTDTSNASGTQDQRRMFGVSGGTLTGQQWVICGSSTNNVSEKSGACRRSDACIAFRTPEKNNGVFPFDAVMQLTVLGSDGFTLNVITQAIANYQVSYLALGGTDITRVNAGGFPTKATTGNLAVTGVGFKPDFLLVATCETGEGLASGSSFGPITGTGPDYPNSSFTSSPTGLGFANSANQAVIMCTGDDGAVAPPTDCKNYSMPGELIATGSSFAGTTAGNILDINGHLLSLDANGFTINYTKVDADGASARADYYYIAIQGIHSSIGTFNTRTDSNPITVSGLPIAPSAVMFLSVNNAQSGTSGTYDTHDAPLSVGFATAASARSAQGARAQNANNSGVNNDNSSIAFDKIYQNVNNSGAIQGAGDLNSLNADGFTVHMTTGDIQANQVHFIAFGPGAPPSTTKSHNLDAYLTPQHGLAHNIDAFMSKPSAHSIDAYIIALTRSYVKLNGTLIDPIIAGNFVKLGGTLLQPSLSFVNLAGVLNSKQVDSFVNLAGTLLAPSLRKFVKLGGILLKPGKSHNIDACVQLTQVGGFVNLNGVLNLPLQECCGTFPDFSFVRLGGYLVKQGDSTQMPGSGFTASEDFLSSQVAGQAYKPFSLFSLNGINLIVTAFTMGVISWQTRTRSWLTLVDAAPGGVVVTKQVQTQQLANGDILTTTTTTEQNQDTTIITVVVVDSGTPTRTTTSVQQINKNGQTTSREIETNTVNGVKNSIEKKNIFTQPPTKDNIQPIKVTTLDGVTHYQWFSGTGIPNEEWAGGDAEGLTTTTTQQTMIPSSLNGKTTDSFGNQIYDLQTVTTEVDPTGKTIQTTTDVIGVQSGVGTTVTDTTTNFNGIITTIHKVTTFPDGSQQVSDTTTNDLTGDSTTTTDTVSTDDFGQVTTTHQVVETKTFTNPANGQPEQTVTTTTSVTVGGVTKTTVTTTTNNNFEDSIVNDKVKVFGIQEYTVECVIDELSKDALLEIQIQQQQQYALQELFGQQLGNSNLSYKLRQRLIAQYNETLCCQKPMLFQANGRTYYVVFANSASAFRAKYIPGTEPHVYELQMILQERSDLISGTQGFG